jgi:hypothetical protein
VGWTLAGFGIGLLAGAALGMLTGRGAPTRVRRALGSWRSPKPAQPTVSTAVREVRAAIEQTDLRPFSIQVTPVKPGVVELRGWVPTRTIRARAVRVAAAVPGIEQVVNNLLVRGEDDKRLKAVPNLADQTA